MSNLKNTIIPWFKKYLKPNEFQYKKLFNSIWFKDEKIPVRNIEGLQELLIEKADTEAFKNHINKKDIHPIYLNNLTLLRSQTLNKFLFSKVLGHSTINDGGQGFFYWDSISEEPDNGGTIVKSNHSEVGRWKRVYSKEVNAKWFGAKGDGETDDTLALQTALNVSEILYIPKGVYLVDELVKQGNIIILGEGKAQTKLISNSSNEYSRVIIIKGDSPLQISSLASNTVKGKNSVVLSSAEDLKNGDLVLIYNSTDGSFSNSRPEYRDGEILKVSHVDGVNVFFHNSVTKVYSSQDVSIYKLQCVEASISNISIRGSSSSYRGGGIEYDFVTNSTLNDVISVGGEHCGAIIKRSFNVNVIHSVFENDKLLGATGTNYGLVISNSQNCNVTKCYMSGYRHGFTTGSGLEYSIPCRYINVSHSYTYSNSIQSLDLHGNAEYCNFSSNFIDKGVVLGGDFHTFSGNTINGDIVNGAIIRVSENTGLNYFIGGNKISSVLLNDITNTGLFIDVQTTDFINKDSELQVVGNNVSIEGGFSGVRVFRLRQIATSLNGKKINLFASDNIIKTSGYKARFSIENDKSTNPLSVYFSDNKLSSSLLYIEGSFDDVFIKNNNIKNSAESGMIITNLEAKVVDIDNNNILDAKNTGIQVKGRGGLKSIDYLCIANNLIKDCNKVSLGSSSVDSSFYVNGAKQVKLFSNTSGSPTSQQKRNYYISNCDELHEGSNIMIPGSNTTKINNATTTIQI